MRKKERIKRERERRKEGKEAKKEAKKQRSKEARSEGRMKWPEQPALQTFRKEVHSVLGRGSGQFDEHRTESSHCALCVVSADGCCRVGRCVILLRSPPWALSFVLFNDIFSARVHAFWQTMRAGEEEGVDAAHFAESAWRAVQCPRRNGWGTHEFRKYAQARGALRTSARMGGGIRGLSHTSLLLWGP